mmetsp:Transcript_17263/g.38911  ORF Transcript_17263/g.38911 Transcript_17263/m.38911 type:complete len:138 (+) Transcript_17263:286-699(+)
MISNQTRSAKLLFLQQKYPRDLHEMDASNESPGIAIGDELQPGDRAVRLPGSSHAESTLAGRRDSQLSTQKKAKRRMIRHVANSNLSATYIRHNVRVVKTAIEAAVEVVLLRERRRSRLLLVRHGLLESERRCDCHR